MSVRQGCCCAYRGSMVQSRESAAISYISGRTEFIQLKSFSSHSSPLTSGVPQGSVLESPLFIIYLLPVGSIFLNRYYPKETVFPPPLTTLKSPCLSHLTLIISLSVHISIDATLIVSVCYLRSSSPIHLIVPSARLSTVGSRVLSQSASSLWISLPPDIHNIDTLPLFKFRLPVLSAEWIQVITEGHNLTWPILVLGHNKNGSSIRKTFM